MVYIDGGDSIDSIPMSSDLLCRPNFSEDRALNLILLTLHEYFLEKGRHTWKQKEYEEKGSLIFIS